MIPTALAVLLAANAAFPIPRAESRPRVDADGFPLPPGAVARIGSSRFRHNDTVTYLLYSTDGKYLLTTTHNEQRMLVWDTANGRLVSRPGCSPRSRIGPCRS